MRLLVSPSKNAASLYVQKSVGRTSVIVEKLGTEKELREKLGGADPYEWARQYIEELNIKEKEATREVIIKYSPARQIPKGVKRSYNGGYLFLQIIYHQLKLNNICKEISKKYKFKYNFDAILSRLIYGRIIFPASKKATAELSRKLIEPPDFDQHQIYRALSVIAKEGDYIQSTLYKNSIATYPRSTSVLFYDCTNFFFEIEQEDGLRQYGKSKENRPNPIVQMGLFIDGSGIPLAFSITKGNMNEQLTLKPLEEKILSDFSLSKFIVCTDAGLSSTANRKFNDRGERSFITTQSIKKLKGHLKKWALDPSGWRDADKELKGAAKRKTYNILSLRNFDTERSKEGEELSDEEKAKRTLKREQLKKRTFYKERWINEDGLEQKLIVTYSLKYDDYQKKIRNRHVERALKLMEQSPKSIKKKGNNDYRRFAEQISITKEGEVCEHTLYELNEALISEEEQYDGFYAVCTNLESSISEIVEINKGRWEIEESFRIMKSEFKSRPAFVSRDESIEAHFATCFISLLIYRLLEKTLNNELSANGADKRKDPYTCPDIVETLRDMNFYRAGHEGYVPNYERTDLTDDLHNTFGFRTDYEIVTDRMMKKIFKDTKK